MTRYRVKTGSHYIGNRVYRAGDVFDIPAVNYHKVEGGRLFEKIGETPAQAAVPPVLVDTPLAVPLIQEADMLADAPEVPSVVGPPQVETRKPGRKPGRKKGGK